MPEQLAHDRRDSERYGDHIRIVRPGAKPYFRLIWTDERTAKTMERSGGRTRDEARRRAKAIEAEIEAGLPTDSARRRATVNRCVDEWLAAPHPRWGPRNADEHGSRMGVHVKRTLGERRMGTLSEEDLAGVLAAMRDTGYAYDSIRNVGASLKAWSKWAHARGFSRSNLMANVSVADYRPLLAEATEERGAAQVTANMVPDRKAWVALADLLSKSRLPWMGLACEISATCGLRYGELAGLRPIDVDLPECVFLIRRALSTPASRPAYWKPTKSETMRRVAFPAYLRSRIAERIAAVQADERNHETLLFSALRGGKLPVTRFHKLALDEALGKLRTKGVWRKQWAWRDLRHSAATWMLAQEPVGLGMSINDLSATLGHSSVDFTLRKYAGFFVGYERRGATAMATFDPRGQNIS